MTAEAARLFLEATAEVGSVELRAYALKVLERWGSEPASPERKGPKSGAERTAEWRKKQRGKPPDPVTIGDAEVTKDVTTRDDASPVPSRALPSSSPSLSSSGSLSPSLLQDPEETCGSMGAREAAPAGSANSNGAPAESGTYALVPPAEPARVTEPVTIGDEDGDGKRHRRNGAKGHRLPKDWKLTPELVAFAEGLGVDAHAIAEQFRDHWMAESGPKAIKVEWDAAYRTWVRKGLKYGDAPMLPEEPAPPAPRGTPEGAARARTLFNGIGHGGTSR